MRSGNLDRYITIQTLTYSQSPSGEPIEAWTNTDPRRPAETRSLSGDERFAAPEAVAKEQVEFRIRYSENVADLTPLSRILHPALTEDEADDPDFVPAERRIHDILAVQEIGRRVALRIVTTRRVDIIL